MPITNRDGALYMATGIDNSGLKQDAAEAEGIIDEIGAKSEKTGSRMQKSFQSMESAIVSTRETISILEKTIASLNSKLDSNSASSSADTKRIAELEAALNDLKLKYDNLNKSVPQTGNNIKQSATQAKQAASDYESLSKSINNAIRLLGIGFSVAGIKAFGSEIINIRGEMQMLESSFEVLLGGKGVSGFMSEMKQFAVDSPLSMNGVANAAQTLLGFGITAEKVMPTIKQIGDISMGNEERFKSLSLAFAQMSATGKLMGQDLLQMINAGFNPLQTISEKTGKSIGDLKKEMESGSISSEMVADAFASATAEGGKFYGMTQKQAEGIKGLQAQLEGGLQDAYNNLGKSQEGLIAGGYKLAISLVENYDKVGKTILELIAIYGTYKAAVIALSVIENIRYQATLAQMAGMTKMQVVMDVLRAKTEALNIAMSKNPYIAVGIAVAALGYGIYKLATYQTEAEKATNRLNDAIKESEKGAISETRELAKLKGELSAAKKGTEEYNSIKEKIVKNYGSYYKGLEAEIEKVGLLDSTYRKLTDSIMKSFGARQYDKFIKEEFDNLDTVLNENLSKIQERIYDRFDDKEAAAKYFANIRNALIEGRDLSKSSISVLDYIQDKGTLTADSRVDSYVKKIREAQKITEEIDIKARERFGIDNKNETKSTEEVKKSFESLSVQTDEARKKVSDLKKELADLRSGKTESNNYSDDIEKKTKELKDAEDKLNLLLYGKSTSEIDKGNKAGESAAEKVRKQAQETADKEKKLKNEFIKAEQDAANIRLENRQQEINLMEESFVKEQSQLDLNHNKELLAIEKRTQELIEKEQERRRKIWDIANPNGAKTPYKNDVNSVLDLGFRDQSELEQSENIANQKNLKSTETLLKNLLGKYQDYNAQRLEINKKYETDLAALESETQKNPTDDKDRAIAELKKQWSEALSSINLEEFQDQIDWSVLFGNLDKISTEELVKLRNKLKDYLSSIGKSLSPQDLKTVTDAFEGLNEKIADKKPISELKDGYDEYKKAVKDAANAQKALNYLVQVGGKDSAAYKTEQNNLADAQDRRRESLIKMSQALNKIGSVGSQMVNSGEELVDMLTNLGIKIPEALKGALSGIGQIMGGLEKIDLTKPASIISGTVSVVAGLGNTIASIFGGGKHKSQKDTERLQEVTSRIEASNEAINKLIEKRISLIKESTAAEGQYLNQLTQEQIKQQQQFVENQFNNVKGNWLFAKKGKNNNLSVDDVMRRYGLTDLADFTEWWNSGGYQELLGEGQGLVDKDMWDSLINSWTELGEAAKNAETAMKETATGTTFDALKDSLDDLVTQADLAFGDISDSFKDHMSQAILKMVKSRYLTKELEKWYDQFASAMDKDSEGGTDLTNSERQALENYYKQIAETANNMYNQAMDLAGIDMSDSVDSSSKGIQSVSQDSFDKYLGNSYAQLQKAGEIRNIAEASRLLLIGINSGVIDIQSIMKENNKVFQDSLGALIDIEKNTARTADILSKIESVGITIRN